MKDIMGLSWRAWWALALVLVLFIFLVSGGTKQRPVTSLEQYQVLGYSFVAALLLIPFIIVVLFKNRASLRLALTLMLLFESVFFLMVPVIPMVETGTMECSLREGFCLTHITYGSVSYVYSCMGTSLQVRTSFTTPSEITLGNKTETLSHFNGTVPSWVPPPVSGYSPSFGCSYA